MRRAKAQNPQRPSSTANNFECGSSPVATPHVPADIETQLECDSEARAGSSHFAASNFDTPSVTERHPYTIHQLTELREGKADEKFTRVSNETHLLIRDPDNGIQLQP